MFVLSLLLIVLTIVALIDVVGQPEPVVRNLPKIVWVLLIVFIPLIGVGLWFLLGKDWSNSRIKLPERRGRKQPRTSGSWGPARGSSPATTPSPSQPDRAVSSTEEQLAALEREIQAAEDAERIRKLELEMQRSDPPADDGPASSADRS
ncbi:PLD nuclease N-terminal domain-containing protein [Plantibacter sp. ME-Dv--P-095]|uniref:PLD nuclease N-terminal domain-containing protein n=1 Tax=Plantibacter sp. ME-Dv--P-095 TaxID=3040299 RepID=UPI00254C1A16|nr:PLD nuclease N-terminal domain-containing protein [Plantibacter sp. ME-Dv--P-095]